MKHAPLSIEELKKQRLPVKNINVEHFEKMTKIEKTALYITEKIGTMGFFFTLLIWTAIWLIWNTLMPANIRFDPVPAFVLWVFISNALQLFLLPLLMIGQNLQNRHAEARAENEYKTNLKAEKEIEIIIQHLENQNEILVEILNSAKKPKVKK
ncbi:MAG: DUF1003 domain-containing protein [Patescibacteria group bacterium]